MPQPKDLFPEFVEQYRAWGFAQDELEWIAQAGVEYLEHREMNELRQKACLPARDFALSALLAATQPARVRVKFLDSVWPEPPNPPATREQVQAFLARQEATKPLKAQQPLSSGASLGQYQ